MPNLACAEDQSLHVCPRPNFPSQEEQTPESRSWEDAFPLDNTIKDMVL